MSGKTGAGAGIGTVIGAAIGSIVPGVGTAIGATAGGLIGGSAGASIGGNMDAADAAKRMQEEMNSAQRREKKPVIPTQDSEAIRASRNIRALQFAQRSGRSSTFLTDKFGG